MRRLSSPFTTIRSEGALLPPEVLTRIADADRDLGGLGPSDYHLGESERLGEAISRSWNRLVGVWASFANSLGGFTTNDPGTGATRERWLAPLFQELGFGRLQVAKAREVDGMDYPISHVWDQVPIHLVGAGVELDRRASGVAGAARMSPHALVQDYLNRTESLWGIVSNGRELRVLRDNVSLTRQAYLAFDVEAMFAGEVYADFALLWLTCHESRFEPQEDKAEESWLERWTQAAQAQGTRALNTLRDGVERAVSTLGAGFLSHPSNGVLRDALGSGALATTDYYRELLRLVYRLIFLFVAEDRALLHPGSTSEEARSRFHDYYSTRRLRQIAERLRGGPYPDLWRSLVFICSQLASDDGCPALGLPFMGSSLFSARACSDLDQAELANRDLLGAIRALAFTEQHQTLRQIDYRNMGSEELGSIYESLLELHPEVNHESGIFSLASAAGNERKTTGSYYTPTSLISALLDTALDPVLDEAAGKPEPEAAILNLKVVDPACGSGHFLVAAAHRIAKRLAAIRTDEPEPSPEAYRHALRDVIARCIFGIDVNPMATELCKVSLWMEAVEPGKPLSFLDHHIACGNSLLGTTPALLAGGIPDDAFTRLEGDDKEVVKTLRRRNKEERKGQDVLALGSSVGDLVRPLAQALEALERLPSDSPEGLHEKELLWAKIQASSEAERARFLADAWCGAFMIRKVKGAPVLTEGVLRLLQADADGGDTAMRAEVHSLAERHKFLHPHLAFPGVFRLPAEDEEPDEPEMGWSGGFDVVIGNPPWDTLSPDAKEFFATYDPRVRFLKKQEQQALIEELLEDTLVATRWTDYRRALFSLVHFIKESGRYRLFAPGNLGKGDFNVYRMFVETALALTGESGAVAQVVPGGFYNGANAQALRKELFEHWNLRIVLGLINTREAWFDGIDQTTRFAAYAALRGGPTRAVPVAFEIRTHADLAVGLEHPTLVPVERIRAESPEALVIQETKGGADSDIAGKMYSKWPSFGDPKLGPPFRHYQRELDMGNDRDRFGDFADGLPVYEGRMVDQFDYRAKAYRSGRGRAAVWEPLPFGSAGKAIVPQWRMPRTQMPTKLGNRTDRYRIGFGDVTSPRNERSLVASLIPPEVICGHSVPTILFEEEWEWAYMPWLAVANSFCMDFLARKKVSLHLTFSVMDSLPFPRLPLDHPVVATVGPLALRLTCTGVEMSQYWNSMAAYGWCETIDPEAGPPGFQELDEHERARVEIEAVVARNVFGLAREELDHILDTFPLVREEDEKIHEEYRIKRLILEAYEKVDVRGSSGLLGNMNAQTTTG